MAKKKITVKEAINVLNTKYANTLGMLDDALDQIEHLENELAKKPKEVQVEVEKVVEVERKVEVPKEVVVTHEVEVPGPERIVEVPGRKSRRSSRRSNKGSSSRSSKRS